EIRRELNNQLGLLFGLKRGGILARRVQTLVQSRRQLIEKNTVQPQQSLAPVQVFKSQTKRQFEGYTIPVFFRVSHSGSEGLRASLTRQPRGQTVRGRLASIVANARALASIPPLLAGSS